MTTLVGFTYTSEGKTRKIYFNPELIIAIEERAEGGTWIVCSNYHAIVDQDIEKVRIKLLDLGGLYLDNGGDAT